jgi:hypothetical protein
MVTALLAWKELTGNQRSKVLDILKKHPHYDEFLAANRPSGFSEDEWVFMRAATWSDWVRPSSPGHHHAEKFHHGTWHYINYPFVPPGASGHVSTNTTRAAFPYAWQTAAAVFSAYVRVRERGRFEQTKLTVEELAARAVRNGDEHAIKFTDVMLAEHRQNGDPIYLAAAEDAIKRL